MKPGRAWWRFVPVVVMLALALLFFWALTQPARAPLPSARQGEPVPGFSLPALNQDRIYTEEIFAGKWSLLNVWATWCPTCRLEHPYLMELARRGVRIIGLNYKDDPDKARAYLARFGDPFAITLVDQSGDYGLDLGVYGAPETYVINPAGEIVLRHVGRLTRRVWKKRIAPVWGGVQPYE